MAEKIDVKTLGHSGVIIDPNTLEPALPDDSLRSAQNATHDPTQAAAGALRKRPGLKPFNLAYAGGPILGGIPMAVAGTGGAPATGGGGNTGSSTGAGDGTGAPGATSDGGAAAYAAAGAGAFGGGSLFGGARLIVIGIDDNTTSSQGAGWYVTSKKLANSASIVTTPGPPGKVYSFPPTATFPNAYGLPMCWHAASGYLFYAVQNTGQVTGGAITIRKTNGGSDVLVCTVPISGGSSAYATGTTIRYAVLTMHLGSDGFIYVGCKDKAAGQDTAGSWGSIFKLDPATNALAQLNVSSTPGATPNGYAGLPYTLALFNGSLYWGEHNLGAGSDTQKDVNADIHGMTTDQTYGVTDHGFSDAAMVSWLYPFPQTAPASNPSMNLAANRILFCGFGVNATSATYAWIYSRDRSALQAAGAYTAQHQGSGGVGAVNGNYFVSAVAFNDKLYASFYNPGRAAKIFEFTPDYTSLATDGGWDGTGTWATVFTDAGGADRSALYLFVDDGVMYAISGAATPARFGMWSTDGSSWTDESANLPAGSHQAFPFPVFAGFNQ